MHCHASSGWVEGRFQRPAVPTPAGRCLWKNIMTESMDNHKETIGPHLHECPSGLIDPQSVAANLVFLCSHPSVGPSSEMPGFDLVPPMMPGLDEAL